MKLSKGLIEAKGVKYSDYKRAFFLTNVPSMYMELRREAKRKIESTKGVTKWFSNMSINISQGSETLPNTLSAEEISILYQNRFFKLIKNRTEQGKKRDTYNSGASYANEFHRLAMLKFIELINPDGDYEA